MSFWRQLAQERELRGVSLADVVERTKISRYTLERMESGEPHHMPARVYLIGYLRAYADAVGLDADDVVLRYEEQLLQSEASDDDGSERVGASILGRRVVGLPVGAWLGGGLAVAAVAAAWVLFI